LFKRTKAIAIPKPGKDGSDLEHYRPFSLLSVMDKLLEWLILQRIQPLIEAATLVHQAGFRKHRSCTDPDQVMALSTQI
jgi:retron-type reverse transcriptase